MSVNVSTGLSALDPRKWFKLGIKAVRWAFWGPDPLTQIAVNIVIFVAASLSSSVTWGLGIFIAVLALIGITIGVIRLVLQLLGVSV